MNESNDHDKSNNIAPTNLGARESMLMDALLSRAVKDEQALDAERVENLMQTISGSAPVPRPSRPWKRWIPAPVVAAAALILVLFVLPLGPFGSNQRQAIAALDRSILAEQSPLVRKYSVSIQLRSDPDGKRIRQHELYVFKKRFAMRISPLFGSGEVWAGGTDRDCWLVPRLGPILIGNEELFLRKMPQKPVIETPFMSVERILQRTRKFYKLSIEPSEITVQGVVYPCKLIVGQRRRYVSNPKVPERVRIWTDEESGYAKRLELNWSQEDSTIWLNASAEMVATPNVDLEFFDHETHHEGDRKVVIVD